MHCTHIYYNYLLITDRIVKILALSIVSLQLAVSKIFNSDFKVCFHILQSTFWLIWILSYLPLFLAFQIDHLDIKINVFNRSSCLPPLYWTHTSYFSHLKLTVPTFKVFIKIVMFDMNRLDIMHLKNKCWRSSWRL
jgi:hypothetical protein